MKNSRFLITGCSSGGKSTLIRQLELRGVSVVQEAGLRVIRSGGPAPWEDLDGFVERVIVLCRRDLEHCGSGNGTVVFDRGLFEAFSGYASRKNIDIRDLMPRPFPYAQPVFFAPHWPAIFEQTEERRLPVEAAIEETDRLCATLGCWI